MEHDLMKSGEILLYSDGSGKEFVNVVFKDETFWLTQKAMAELFDVNVPAISRHLQNIYEEEELQRDATVSKMETVQSEGGRTVRRTLDFYNLDAIIAVGYRVSSKKATRFRQWATRTLKEYIQKGFRLNRLVTMFIDYAELMAEDEQLMSMQDWLDETDRFLTNNRRNVLEGKGSVSNDDAVKKVGAIYAEFRKRQDADYISEFDRQTAKYLKGESR